MTTWFWYAVGAAVLYGAHQICTKLAADKISDGIGGFVVEATAALSILLYLAFLYLTKRWDQKFSADGFWYSVLTGICVGAGTVAFFLLFQKGGPLSSVPVRSPTPSRGSSSTRLPCPFPKGRGPSTDGQTQSASPSASTAANFGRDRSGKSYASQVERRITALWRRASRD